MCVCVHVRVTARGCAEAGVHARVCMSAHVTACMLTTRRMGDMWMCVYLCVGWRNPRGLTALESEPLSFSRFSPKKVRKTKATQARNWQPRAPQDPGGNRGCWQNHRPQGTAVTPWHPGSRPWLRRAARLLSCLLPRYGAGVPEDWAGRASRCVEFQLGTL